MMLTTEYPQELDCWTLGAACEELKGDPATDIPWLMWLLENPDSPLALPGNIGLYNHDCMHLILKQGFSSENEAYVVTAVNVSKFLFENGLIKTKVNTSKLFDDRFVKAYATKRQAK